MEVLHSKEYIKISDSLQLAERQNRNKLARIEYETEEKSSGSGVLRIYSPAMDPAVRYDMAFKFYASDLGWK